MDDLEQQLKSALSRRQPPPWLYDRILAAAAEGPHEPAQTSRWSGMFTGWRLRWASAAVATCLVASGVVWQRERAERERIAGLEAKARLELALKVTGDKLRRIQQIVSAMELDQ